MIATGVTLRIFFYGLIAFTPDNFKGGELMRALLLDAQSPPAASDGCPIHHHEPTLVFKSSSCKFPCYFYEDDLCKCPLGEGYLLEIPRTGAAPPPAATSRNDFDDFVPNMSSLRFFGRLSNQTNLREDCDRTHPDQESLCELIAAQVNFHPSEVEACLIIKSNFEFRPLASRNLFTPNIPATSEIIGFAVPTETQDPNRSSLALKFKPVNRTGHNEQVLEFSIAVPIDQQGNADVIISNSPVINEHGQHGFDRCNSDSVARDFELFHDLTVSPLYVSDRLVPHADSRPAPKSSTSRVCNSGILKKLLDSRLRAGNARPICPEAAL